MGTFVLQERWPWHKGQLQYTASQIIVTTPSLSVENVAAKKYIPQNKKKGPKISF
jgi:hypothetical protein